MVTQDDVFLTPQATKIYNNGTCQPLDISQPVTRLVLEVKNATFLDELVIE